MSKDKDRVHYGCESHEQDPYEIDLDASHLSWYKQTMEKRHQDTVFSVHIKNLLNRTDLFSFYHDRTISFSLHETLPVCCLPSVIMTESEEIMYEKGYMSPQLLPKISSDVKWMKELHSEVAEDSQQIQSKSKTQFSRTSRLVSEQPL